MIAKFLIFFLLFIILPDVILWYRFGRKYRWWMQILWFVPGLLFVIATVMLARERDFVPDDMTFLNVYLLLMGLVTLPKAIVAVFSLFCRSAWKVGVLFIPIVWFVIIYGSFFGNNKLEVKQVELSFADLPASFDGFRIVQFTDAHVGSIRASFLKTVVDSINAQKADLVVFTGDLQNKHPKEIKKHQDVLSGIQSEHGVISVMGNHDYAFYVDDASEETKAILKEYTIGSQQDMNWSVLVNGRRIFQRGTDSLIVAGLDNDGEGRFPQKGNINSALSALSFHTFVVMLEHDPSSWRRKILPHCHAQLTLSGHTHGMQFELFGWSPLRLFKKDVDGLSRVGKRYLYVSKGIGGVVPFRFGATPEIVVFTLRRQS